MYLPRISQVISWVEAEYLQEDQADTEAYAQGWAKVRAADGVLVPGGFGDRGIEGKIAAAKYARERARSRTSAHHLLSACIPLPMYLP